MEGERGRGRGKVRFGSREGRFGGNGEGGVGGGVILLFLCSCEEEVGREIE